MVTLRAWTCQPAGVAVPAATTGCQSGDGVYPNPGGELVFARAIFAKRNTLGWIGE